MIEPSNNDNPIVEFIRSHAADDLPIYDLRRNPNTPLDDETVIHLICRLPTNKYIAFCNMFDWESARTDSLLFPTFESIVEFHRLMSLDPNSQPSILPIEIDDLDLDFDYDSTSVAYIAVTLDI